MQNSVYLLTKFRQTFCRYLYIILSVASVVWHSISHFLRRISVDYDFIDFFLNSSSQNFQVKSTMLCRSLLAKADTEKWYKQNITIYKERIYDGTGTSIKKYTYVKCRTTGGVLKLQTIKRIDILLQAIPYAEVSLLLLHKRLMVIRCMQYCSKCVWHNGRFAAMVLQLIEIHFGQMSMYLTIIYKH